jgi:hypothetical protein
VRGIVEMGLVAVCVRMVESVIVVMAAMLARVAVFGATMRVKLAVLLFVIVLVPVVMPMRFMTVRMRRVMLMIVAMSRFRFVTFVFFVVVFVVHFFAIPSMISHCSSVTFMIESRELRTRSKFFSFG